MTRHPRVITPAVVPCDDDDEDVGMAAALAVVALYTALCVLAGSVVTAVALTVGRGAGCLP